MKVINKYLDQMDTDHFHHIGFSTADVDIKKEFSNVKVSVSYNIVALLLLSDHLNPKITWIIERPGLAAFNKFHKDQTCLCISNC